MNRNRAGRALRQRRYLTPAERLVFHELLEKSDNADCKLPERFTPSVATLAEWTGLNRATVFRAVAHLERHGWMQRESGDGRGHKSQYSLVVRDPDDSCDCPKRVARRDRFGDTANAQKGRTKGRMSNTQRVASDTSFSQVITAVALKGAGMKGLVGMHEDKQEAQMDESNRADEAAAARARLQEIREARKQEADAAANPDRVNEEAGAA